MTALITTLISTFSHITHGYARYSTKRILRDIHKWKLPVPSVPHLMLDNSKIKNRQLLIIGDVHGCLDELNELLDIASSKVAFGYLPVFVGDIINKGPKNLETIERLQHLEHFCVRGNHDDYILRHVMISKEKREYIIPEKYQWVKHLTDAHVRYLQELPYTISIPEFNVLFVHAGLVPGRQLAEQNLVDMILMRNLKYDSEGKFKASEGIEDGEPWASVWAGPEHVYFGHDARRKLQKFPYATGLDTGCVYGFHLTAVLLDKDGNREFIQTKAKQIYEKPKDTTFQG